MAEEIRHPDGRIEHPSVRSEKSDADFRWVFRLIVAAALLGVIIWVAVWWFFVGESNQLARERRSPFPLAPGPSTALPPEPRLEQLDRMVGDPRLNVWNQQKKFEDTLAGYEDTQEKGFVRIPIERAMEYLATTKKLPARDEKAQAVPRDNGLVGGGEPNSGRLFNRRKPRWFGP
jgi:hypothetical protein